MLMPRLKKLKPFGMLETPFNPLSGKRLKLGDVDGDIAVMDVLVVGSDSNDFGDIILCRKTGADDDSQRIEVYKPYMLRRSPFDGQTVDEIEYVYSDNYSRTAEGEEGGEYEGEGEDQFVVPPYLIGEQIIAVKFQFSWVDLNNAGRCWAAEVE